MNHHQHQHQHQHQDHQSLLLRRLLLLRLDSAERPARAPNVSQFVSPPERDSPYTLPQHLGPGIGTRCHPHSDRVSRDTSPYVPVLDTMCCTSAVVVSMTAAAVVI